MQHPLLLLPILCGKCGLQIVMAEAYPVRDPEPMRYAEGFAKLWCRACVERYRPDPAFPEEGLER